MKTWKLYAIEILEAVLIGVVINLLGIPTDNPKGIIIALCLVGLWDLLIWEIRREK